MSAKTEMALEECQWAAMTVEPPIDPIRIFNDDPSIDDHFISRLRAIIGARLYARGFTKTDVSKLFRQTFNATDRQIQRAAKYFDEPRFRNLTNKPPCKH
jgi:hypothetical protein